jgi:hypothetical protein
MIAIENGSTPSEATKTMPVVDGETLDAARITAIATPESGLGQHSGRPTPRQQQPHLPQFQMGILC